MTWNYRVIRHKEGHLALHEVYYNEAGQPRAYSQQPVTFIGDGDDALQELIGARKHAMRVLRGGAANRRSAPRPERRLYDEAVSEALIVLWEASDRVCGKRLKALAPILVRRWSGTGISSLLPRSARVCWG